MFIRHRTDWIHIWPGALAALGLAVLLWFLIQPSTFANELVRGTEITFHAEHEDFVGDEPPVCDILDFDGPLLGEIFGESPSISSKIRATFDQFGCRFTGTMEIMAAGFSGSGPFYGVIDGNVLRFTVTSETSDADRDRNFSGLLNGDSIAGQYPIPHTNFVSEWRLFIGDSGPVSRLTDLKDSVADSPLIKEIRELQSELVDLRDRRAKLSEKLGKEVEEESAQITAHWEQEIEDLRTEIEGGVVEATEVIEQEKREVTARLGRNRVVVDLDRELDVMIADMWAWFNEEAGAKRELMKQELSKLEITKATQVDRLTRSIQQLQRELDQKLKTAGITLDQILDQSEDQPTNNATSQGSNTGAGNKVTATGSGSNDSDGNDQPPVPPSGDDSGNSRGFFFNSESGALGDLGESLDPSTLAVLGILITLAATAIQLVKGN